MALAIEMLGNAFNRNMDVAWLIAGDGDYSALVSEVKRYGTVVNVSFFGASTSPNLRLAADEFYPMEFQIPNKANGSAAAVEDFLRALAAPPLKA